MLVKHLMAESSGISYEQWSDYEMFDGTKLGMNYGAAAALRKQKSPKGYFTSAQIIGQDVTLEEYVDAIAEAGILVCEPGEFSYGLGALVLGRVIEVVYQRMHQLETPLSLGQIMKNMLWEPLEMHTAAFFLEDGDPRREKVPQLYGANASKRGDRADVKPYSECLPKTQFENTCHSDQYAGARKCEPGDTGACMTVRDYAKFYDFLLRGGLTPKGERILSVNSVHALTHRQMTGLERQNPLAAWMGLTGKGGQPHSFNFGWAVSHTEQEIGTISAVDAPRQCFWSGYANNHGVLYPDDDAYILIFPQLMGSSTGGYLYAA